MRVRARDEKGEGGLKMRLDRVTLLYRVRSTEGAGGRRGRARAVVRRDGPRQNNKESSCPVDSAERVYTVDMPWPATNIGALERFLGRAGCGPPGPAGEGAKGGGPLILSDINTLTSTYLCLECCMRGDIGQSGLVIESWSVLCLTNRPCKKKRRQSAGGRMRHSNGRHTITLQAVSSSDAILKKCIFCFLVPT